MTYRIAMNVLSIPVAHLSPLDRLAAENAVRDIAPKFPQVDVRLNYEPQATREEHIEDSGLRTFLRTELDDNYNRQRSILHGMRHRLDPCHHADELRAGLDRLDAGGLASELAKIASPTAIVTKNLVLELIDRTAGPLPTALLDHARRDSHTYAFRLQDWSPEEIAATIDRTRELLAKQLRLIANRAPYQSATIREDIISRMIAASNHVRQ